MYLTFYGLREKPFGPTPNPRFLYLTAGHREALAQLLYGVNERMGFIMLTGEIGTGKTTLLRTMLDRLKSNTAVAFVFNSTLAFDGILQYMLEDLGVTKTGDSRAERLFALNHFLIDRQRSGQNTVLILDEAQNLDVPTLEQIRLLSNFETESGKLIQILLVGQPELRIKLGLRELRQLRQRIGLRCAIEPLRARGGATLRAESPADRGRRRSGLFTDAALAGSRATRGACRASSTWSRSQPADRLRGPEAEDRPRHREQAIAYLEEKAEGARGKRKCRARASALAVGS